MQSDHRDNTLKLGHSENTHGESEPLGLHLQSVASRCGGFAEAFGCEDEGRVCGLLHDLGKMGTAGQKRMRGIGRSVDHWSYGAHRLLDLYKVDGVAAAFCTLGHHRGLGCLNETDLKRLLRIEDLREHIKGQRRTLSEVSRNEADEWLADNGLTPPESISSLRPGTGVSNEEAAAMADVRMLFSALVDADFLETEAHFRATAPGQRYERPESPELQPERALRLMLEYIDKRRQEATATEHVVNMRDDLLAACRDAAQKDPDVFTLSAPTGSGKTLAMLAFALEHAKLHGLRRIVLVVPYLSIIEQTAGIYREIFEGKFGPHYVLEHHSLAQPVSKDNGDDETEKSETARLLTENWDAPIVITTSVQFFESLFSNRTSACRKLHRLAGGVVLFDEVQTFPKELAIPTLATLAHLARRHRCTTVFATATQPAFTHFDEHVKQIGGPGWQPSEIVPSELNLFGRAKRTTVHWPQLADKTTWNSLARALAGCERVLCVVNLKKHAVELVDRLRESVGTEGLFHLSTNMCPAHREKTLQAVRDRLDNESAGPCRLIATQCIEAGVDIDFPAVYRAMGPLEAIAQAAGRCNRNGRLPIGEVHVFSPDIKADGKSNGVLYPARDYKQAAMRTQNMLNDGEIDIDSPDMFKRYYRGLYELSDFSDTDIIKAVKGLDFEETAKLYRLINQQTVNLVVPYDQNLFESLYETAHEEGLSGDWIRNARPLGVSIYGTGEQLAGFAEPVPLPDWAQNPSGANASDEWFFLPETASESYDRELLGLGELPKSCAWIA